MDDDIPQYDEKFSFLKTVAYEHRGSKKKSREFARCFIGSTGDSRGFFP
jgi:hypothetical protein